MKTIAVYPGTFDPVTNGHIDLIHRAAKIFPELIVAVATSHAKKPFFNLQERLQLLHEAIGSNGSIKIMGFHCLLIDFVKEQKASIIIMGVLCGFGGVLGLGNLTSVVMLIAPAKTTLAIAQILGRISQVLLSLVLSALLAKITFNVKKQIDTS